MKISRFAGHPFEVSPSGELAQKRVSFVSLSRLDRGSIGLLDFLVELVEPHGVLFRRGLLQGSVRPRETLQRDSEEFQRRRMYGGFLRRFFLHAVHSKKMRLVPVEIGGEKAHRDISLPHPGRDVHRMFFLSGLCARRPMR